MIDHLRAKEETPAAPISRRAFIGGVIALAGVYHNLADGILAANAEPGTAEDDDGALIRARATTEDIILLKVELEIEKEMENASKEKQKEWQAVLNRLAPLQKQLKACADNFDTNNGKEEKAQLRQIVERSREFRKKYDLPLSSRVKPLNEAQKKIDGEATAVINALLKEQANEKDGDPALVHINKQLETMQGTQERFRKDPSAERTKELGETVEKARQFLKARIK